MSNSPSCNVSLDKTKENENSAQKTNELNSRMMSLALEQARKAGQRGEIPIGAVIVRNGKVIARAHNRRERTQNALNHAEVIAIRKACRKLRSWRLDDCEMYVTLQPCIMCAGAILNARIRRVVIGALSDRTNDLDVFAHNNLNWTTEVDVLNDPECASVLRDFFREKR